MIEGVGGAALAALLIAAATFEAGIAALRRTIAPDDVFCDNFFKAVARKEMT